MSVYFHHNGILFSLTPSRQLSSLGAIITILALAADPFNQQILSYPVKPGSSGNATVPFALSFQTRGADATSMHTTMANAIYQGLYGSESQNPAQNLPFQYPKGICTWSSEVISLGICSESADISSHMTSNCQATTDESTNEN